MRGEAKMSQNPTEQKLVQRELSKIYRRLECDDKLTPEEKQELLFRRNVLLAEAAELPEEDLTRLLRPPF
jgi:hypothetical protein